MNDENPVKLMMHRQGWLLKSRVKHKIEAQEAMGNGRFVLVHYCYLMTRNKIDGLY